MPSDVRSYFNSIRSYLQSQYFEVLAQDGKIQLKEGISCPPGSRERKHTVKLGFSGTADDVIVFRLDKKKRGNHCEPLFSFLEDDAKPWAKRCDFVIFQLVKRRIVVYCIEFKSNSLTGEVVDQLKASEAWCRSVHSIFKNYLNESKRLHLKKFVFSCRDNASNYLEDGKYLMRDHYVRHYHYDDLNEMTLENLDNDNDNVIPIG